MNYRAQQSQGRIGQRSRAMKLVHMLDPDDVIFDFRTMAERVNPG